MKFCETLKEKNHGLVQGILEELLYLGKALVQHIKNPVWAIKKQPAERGKRAIHFRCFCIKCTLKSSRNRGNILFIEIAGKKTD